jgi:hypothetical protein
MRRAQLGARRIAYRAEGDAPPEGGRTVTTGQRLSQTAREQAPELHQSRRRSAFQHIFARCPRQICRLAYRYAASIFASRTGVADTAHSSRGQSVVSST